ncbi:MAG: universal stress protein [Balneolaceae bacterium]
MVHAKHWLVCLDLSNMDEILIGYSKFLSTVVEPESITFFHVIQSDVAAREIINEFPEVKSREDFEALIRQELKERIHSEFGDSKIEIRIVIKEGFPTDQIIEFVNSLAPDLLLVGKKMAYEGEGIIPKRIVKYVASSVLFVPETCRYILNRILVGVDFSEESARALGTAQKLLPNEETRITAQHVFRYKARFFPYTFSPEEKEEAAREIEKKKEKFVKEYRIPSDIHFALTLHREGRIANTIYDQAIRDQSDLIVIGSKSKKLSRIIRQDFTDKMVDYAFGIPLLVLKDKANHQKVLKKLFQ